MSAINDLIERFKRVAHGEVVYESGYVEVLPGVKIEYTVRVQPNRPVLAHWILAPQGVLDAAKKL